MRQHPSQHNLSYASVRSVLSQSGESRCNPLGGIGPDYAAPLYLKRGHRIRNIFSSLFRWVRPLLWRRAKDVGRETLCSGGNILNDIEENKSPKLSPKNFVSKYVTKRVRNLIGNLRRGGCKRTRGVSSMMKKRKKAKRACLIKRVIFS